MRSVMGSLSDDRGDAKSRAAVRAHDRCLLATLAWPPHRKRMRWRALRILPYDRPWLGGSQRVSLDRLLIEVKAQARCLRKRQVSALVLQLGVDQAAEIEHLIVDEEFDIACVRR